MMGRVDVLLPQLRRWCSDHGIEMNADVESKIVVIQCRQGERAYSLRVELEDVVYSKMVELYMIDSVAAAFGGGVPKPQAQEEENLRGLARELRQWRNELGWDDD